MEKKSIKCLIIVVLVIVIVCLGGYILYNKTSTSSSKKEDQTKNTKKEVKKDTPKEITYDLSNIPETSDACTFTFSFNDYNNIFKNGNNVDMYSCDNSLYKYVINDVKLNDINQNVQLVFRPMEQDTDKAGIYINGIKHDDLDSSTMVNLNIYHNLLMVSVNGGTSVTGIVNALAFDSKGKEQYNLAKILNERQITDPNSPTKAKVLSTNILRNNFSIDSDKISFRTYTTQGSACYNGSRGSVYEVKYDGKTFSDPTYVSGWKMENDDCTEPFD